MIELTDKLFAKLRKRGACADGIEWAQSLGVDTLKEVIESGIEQQPVWVGVSDDEETEGDVGDLLRRVSYRRLRVVLSERRQSAQGNRLIESLSEQPMQAH